MLRLGLASLDGALDDFAGIRIDAAFVFATLIILLEFAVLGVFLEDLVAPRPAAALRLALDSLEQIDKPAGCSFMTLQDPLLALRA